MELKTAFEIIDICSDLNIRHITLIGGEPTLYPYLFDVIRYSSDKNIKCGFVSNGLKYSDNSFLQKLISHGIKNFSISFREDDTKHSVIYSLNIKLCNFSLKLRIACGELIIFVSFAKSKT